MTYRIQIRFQGREYNSEESFRTSEEARREAAKRFGHGAVQWDVLVELGEGKAGE